MPRSRSRSIESSTCDSISRSESAPQSWMNRSARVDLPWSTCAMIEKFRIRSMAAIEGGRLIIQKGRRAAGGSLGQKALDPGPVERIARQLDAGALEHRDPEPVAPLERRVAADVDGLDDRVRRQQGRELLEQLLAEVAPAAAIDRKSTRLNSSHV